ncbi:hypothetical protein B0T26DRAFT_672885 [Lasiosphaeria miniovina]|uniref:Uncharacterized protein n=1 Tax=Lasiosphaeria miniovina TaxID=1954250 RepID=A0AA40B652_9PEZI|nr:uncharacterized protein B0T26DRAFT_672885 [Lasiosphaeria miniovina]KAK0728338.1 hypothetical protein B0T26DRAFT_672885 [Lasiosphaeria miniovina]
MDTPYYPRKDPVPGLRFSGCDLCGTDRLPMELVQQVWKHLPRSILRGSGDVIGIAHRFAVSTLKDPDGRRESAIHLAFAILDGPHPDATLQFKYGLGHLYLPMIRRLRHPHIWDTPSPPRLGRFQTHGAFAEHNQRLQTAKMDRITRLTFLHYDNDLVAIHPHTQEEPSATVAVERFSPGSDAPRCGSITPSQRSKPISLGQTRKNSSKQCRVSYILK